MKALQAIVRIVSGTTAPLELGTQTSSSLLELTETQLDQVAGGGGKASVGTAGSGVNGAFFAGNSGPKPIPDGGKGGMQGDMC